MDQAEFELQLKVWKELAISKQVLMRAVTDALGIDPESKSEELKTAIEAIAQKANTADGNIGKAREDARTAIAEMEKEMIKSRRAKTAAETAAEEARTALTNAEQRIETSRLNNAQDIKKMKAQVAEKQKALKAINVALADTPENVVKKLKALKKEKVDEASARKKIENDARTLRKDKQGLKLELTQAQTALTQSAELVEKYRELHQQCVAYYDQLKPLVDDDSDLTPVPELDEQWLEAITQAVAEPEESEQEEKEEKEPAIS